MKIAMDGTHRRPNGEIIAAFTADETREMVEEIHRLGCQVAPHTYGREAVLNAARAGVDLIVHAFYMDDEYIEAMLESSSTLAPTMTFPKNTVDFCQPHDPAITTGYAGYCARTLVLGARYCAERARLVCPLPAAATAGSPRPPPTANGMHANWSYWSS